MLETSGTSTTRPRSRLLISRSPSRISRPMFRFALAIFHFLANLSDHVRGNVLRHVLRVHRQWPDQAVDSLHVMDDTVSASLTAPRATHRSLRMPPEPGITGPASGSCTKAYCQAVVLVVAQVLEDELCEQPRLDEAEQRQLIRLRRIPSRDAAAIAEEICAGHWASVIFVRLAGSQRRPHAPQNRRTPCRPFQLKDASRGITPPPAT